MNELFAQHPILLVSLVKIVVLLFLLLTSLAYLVWFERKVAAHIQGRWGPYRVGPHGLMQPLADGLKFLFKEDTTPGSADRFVYFLAPFLSLSLAISTIALIPLGPGTFRIFGQTTSLVVANVNIGLLAIFAITSIGVYGVALAGWSSNNKYSLLGGLRSAAQMVSYELSLTMSVAGVLLLGRHIQSERDRYGAKRQHLGLSAALESAEPHRSAIARIFLLFRGRRRGNQSPAVRLCRGGVRIGGRLPYRIFQLQVRDVFHG